MGVPAFFRWLSQKYPSIVVHCVEKRSSVDDDGNRVQPKTDNPDINGIYDNFYLDMNAIIHPCTHPENKAAPKNEDEMFVAVFEYIDRLIALIRPKRMIYMAVDGVAPRAKMNQQRSRRFRAAKESREKLQTMTRLRTELAARNAYLPAPKPESEHFDSNCITPGTPFMARLALALRYYIYERLNSDPLWSNVTVLLSDANVPGEGEHKIMDFIRRQRSQPDHDPNTKHCLFGADADLIMLGLATHEPHFTIIREEFKPNQPRPCELCGQVGHEMEDCVGAPKPIDPNLAEAVGELGEGGGEPPMPGAETDFIFIKLDILRQYLEQDLQLTNITFTWDLERVIDDWVFICFFVGNDFLPHLPCLEIRENAIDRLIEIYKSAVQKTGCWLTDSGKVQLDKVQLMMTELGKMEAEIFQKRRESELNFRQKKKWRNSRGGGGGGGFNSPPWARKSSSDSTRFLEPVALGRGHGVAHPQGRYQGSPVSSGQFRDARQELASQSNWVDRNLNNLEAATAMRAMLHSNRSGPGEQVEEQASGASPAKRPKLDEDEEADARDEVRLWEEGWRSRYYQSKFGVDPEDASVFCSQVAHEYAIGLCWVLAYYFQGCASWDWYYPYHYAPFAFDFTDMDTVNTDFSAIKSVPFKPLEQLMGVFPADSRSHVPPAWHDLMTDPDSLIIDFYPTDFKVDLNGKRYAWMGVALLPFVDEKRLLPALEERRHLLTEDELARNIRGPDRLFCRSDHDLCPTLVGMYSSATSGQDKSERTIDPKLTHGLAGRVWPEPEIAYTPGSSIPSAVPSLLPAIKRSCAVSVGFADPPYPEGFVFPAVLLEKVTMPTVVQLLPPERGRGGPRRSGGGRPFRSPGGGPHRNQPMDRMIRGSLHHDDNRGGYNQSRSFTNYLGDANNSRSYDNRSRGGYNQSHQSGFNNRGYGGYNQSRQFDNRSGGGYQHSRSFDQGNNNGNYHQQQQWGNQRDFGSSRPYGSNRGGGGGYGTNNNNYNSSGGGYGTNQPYRGSGGGSDSSRYPRSRRY